MKRPSCVGSPLRNHTETTGLKLDLAIQTAKINETATGGTGELHCHPSGASASASINKLHTSQKKDK